MNKSQKGFAVIETLLIAVVVAILGGTGYYVWHTKQKTDESLNNTSKTSLDLPKNSAIKTYDDCVKSPGSTEQETYPPVCVTKAGQRFTQSTTQSYFTISEWGVRFVYNGKLHLQYKIENGKHAFFTSKELTNATGCEESGGVISRDFGSDVIDPAGETPQELYGKQNANVRKIGEYYFVYESPQALCEKIQSIDDPATVLQRETQTDVIQMFGTVEAVPN